ncbi:MAG: ABC transporter substrate-binding protein [Halomonas sp.]
MRRRIPLGPALLALILLVAADAVARDTVRIELQLTPPHLDPTTTPSATTAEAVHLNVFEGLTRIDRKGRVQPLLAEAWRVEEEGRVLRLALARGVRFHDGRRFDAETARFSLARLLDPEEGNPQRHLFAAIEAVEVVDDHTLRLHLSRPDALLPYRLGLSAAVMVHPASAQANREAPVGTGPYRVDGWKDEALHLERFDDYWGDRPAIRAARITFTANRIELENSLSEGAIDLYPDGSSLSSHLQLAQRHDYVIEEGLSAGETLLAVNHAREPLGDRRVRRALAHAIDRQAMLDIYPGIRPPLIGSHFSPLHPAYVDLADRYPHDPQRARALLDEAGQADGLRLHLVLPTTIYAERAGLYVAADLEAVGIEVTVERLGWRDWLERVFEARDYDLTLISHVEPLDLDIYAREEYYFNYRNPEFDALWARIEAAQEETERHALLGQAQRLLADDVAAVYLFLKPHQSIRKARLEGAWRDAPIPAVPIAEMSWE